MDPFSRVVEWRPVSNRGVLHRAEPLLHERMWGCSLPLPDDQRLHRSWHEEGGYDADGQPVAWRQVDHSRARPADEPGVREVAVVEHGAVAVHLAGGGVARTSYGEHGLPERTDYSETQYSHDPSHESYEYDALGRLVAIEESDTLWGTMIASERYTTGGRLTVEHDEHGPRRIASEIDVVWERLEIPWPQQLQAGAATIADACLQATKRACEEHAVPPGTEVFALNLVYVEQGSLHTTLSFGLERDRRQWRADGLDGEEMACNLFYVNANHEGLNFIDDDVVEAELDQQLLRAACAQQPRDPYRTVLGAVAERLARA